MASIILTHEVGDFETWLSKENRANLFPTLCESYRLFRVPGENRVAVLLEGVDLDKVEAMLGSDVAATAMAEDSVLPPVHLHVQLDGAR